MSKKHKSGRGRQGSDLYTRAQRELAKGNVKEALKDAKLCYRDDPAPAHRALLEQAYCARAAQLQKAGLPDQAKNALNELTELGVSSPEVQAQLPRLRILLGLTDGPATVDPTALWNENPELLVELVDRGVLQPRQISAKYADLRRDCERVREALAAVEQGQDQTALELLNDISRRSPHADWRLFVRGLIAFYAGDIERARANWDRLDARRSAFRISRTLLIHAGHLSADQAAFDVESGLRRLRYAVEADPALDQLKIIGDYARAGHWSKLFPALRDFVTRYRSTHAALIEQVTDILWKRLVRDDSGNHLNRLIQIAPPPRLDPRWNRARAFRAEHDPQFDWDSAETGWKAYIDDLTRGDILPPDECRLAIALIYQRLADRTVDAADAARARNPFPSPFAITPLDHTIRASAVRHYERAIEHAPRLAGIYHKLATQYLVLDREREAVKTYQKLLKRVPDDHAAHVWLASYYLESDQPDKAERHAREAQRLAPRDPETAVLMWNQRIAMLRQCTKKRKFAAARHEWEQMQQAVPPEVEPFWVDLLRAAIEYKANNVDVGEQYVAAALAKLADPTPIWMVMHMYASQFGMKREIKALFGDRFKASVAGPCCSETARHLTRALFPYVAKQLKYTNLATHCRLVQDYLHRCTEVTWRCEDLRYVLRFLREIGGWRGTGLHKTMTTRGVALFPDDPMMALEMGIAEMQSWSYREHPAETRKWFQSALTLHETARLPMPKEALEIAKQNLAKLDDIIEAQASIDARGAWYEDDNDSWDEDDADAYGFDSDDGEFGDFWGGFELDPADLDELERAEGLPIDDAPRVELSEFIGNVLHHAATSMKIPLAELVRRIETGEVDVHTVMSHVGIPNLLKMMEGAMDRPSPSGKRNRSKRRR